MVGPLRIALPAPPPWLGMTSGRAPAAHRVLVGRRGYRVLWKPATAGLPVHVWEEQMRRGLAVRYGARVVAGFR